MRLVVRMENVHVIQRSSGTYTLSGLVEYLKARGGGELVGYPNLELAVRVWARTDPRPRRALRIIDRTRLLNATAMTSAEMPSIGSAAEVAILVNAVLQGRQLLYVDGADEPLASAYGRALDAFVTLCTDAAIYRRGRSGRRSDPAR